MSATAPNQRKREDRRAGVRISAKRRLRLQTVQTPRVWSLGALGVFAFFMLFGALFGSVFVQTAVVQSQVHKDQLQTQIGEQTELQARLSLRVSRLESPDRIRAEAQVRLGMITPDDRPYLAPVVPDDPSSPLAPPGDNPFGNGG